MLSLEAGNQAVWDQLIHLLPKLRQALSCRVCRRLLIDPTDLTFASIMFAKAAFERKDLLTLDVVGAQTWKS